jgi:hypothetical protein
MIMTSLQEGWTALMLAARYGRTATAAELVRLGADISAKTNVSACRKTALPSETARVRVLRRACAARQDCSRHRQAGGQDANRRAADVRRRGAWPACSSDDTS